MCEPDDEAGRDVELLIRADRQPFDRHQDPQNARECLYRACWQRERPAAGDGLYSAVGEDGADPVVSAVADIDRAVAGNGDPGVVLQTELCVERSPTVTGESRPAITCDDLKASAWEAAKYLIACDVHQVEVTVRADRQGAGCLRRNRAAQ